MLLTTPAARALRRRFPEAQIDFMAEPPCHEVLQGNPRLSRVLRYERSSPWAMMRRVRRERYDWVVDFLGNPRSALLTAFSGASVRAGAERVFHRWAYNRRLKSPAEPCYVGEEKMRLLEQLGVPPDENPSPELVIPELSRRFSEAFYRTMAIPPERAVVTMAPAARRVFNRWFPERYARLCDWLRTRFGAAVVLVWGPGERPLAEDIAQRAAQRPFVGPQTQTLMDLAALLSRADLHVGADNGPKHIAAAAGAPTFTIYGPHSPISWTPPDPARHRYIRRDCLCRDNPARDKHRCPDRRCLDLIEAEDVEKELEPFLAGLLARKARGAAKP